MLSVEEPPETTHQVVDVGSDVGVDAVVEVLGDGDGRGGGEGAQPTLGRRRATDGIAHS